MEKLDADFKKMQQLYSDAVKFFGEDSQRTEPSEFFTVFSRFADDFQVQILALFLFNFYFCFILFYFYFILLISYAFYFIIFKK